MINLSAINEPIMFPPNNDSINFGKMVTNAMISCTIFINILSSNWIPTFKIKTKFLMKISAFDITIVILRN